MKNRLKTILKKVVGGSDRRESHKPDFVEYNGMRLPPPSIRFCTTDWKDDSFFVTSAINEVRRLQQLAGLTKESTILDIGSGQGRLAVGILASIPDINAYYGIDVSLPSVEWCKRNIAALHPNFQFVYTDFSNPRYAPNGVAFRHPIQLPFSGNTFDVVFLYSVFTHMDSQDISMYLKEIHRMLVSGGKALFTVYAEQDCPDEEENPNGYLSELGKSAGRLHRVRFNRGYFDGLILSSGFRIEHFFHQCEDVTKQSIYVVASAS